jgi:hypothetical protein
MSNYRVIVSTCDKYLPYLKPFIHQFNKYWGNEQRVLVAGFTQPDWDMPNNFRFHSIGKMKDYPIDKWSDSIIALLRYITDDVVVFMLEDYWLTRQVDIEGVQLLVDYARTHTEVVRIDLTSDRYDTMRNHPEYKGLYDYKMGKLGHLDLVRSPNGAPYSLAMITSVWRKDNILKVLEPGWNPWQVEIEGTRNVYKHGDEMCVIGTENNPVPHCVGIRRLIEGDPRLWLEGGFFTAEDNAELKALGYIGETGYLP